jgi:O-methyltransferase involved in polyketide biosynthesis
MEINNIEITQEKETLFITLYAKALDYKSRKPILNDQTAHDIINSLDYDFSKLRKLGGEATVIRTRQIDDWINEFIDINKDSVVLNLGCGLDSRIKRINPPLSVFWYDIDFPEVVELREKYYSIKMNNYYIIGTSVNENNWYKNIPNNLPVIIVADGVFEYLTSDEVKILFERFTNYFSNGEIIFDVMSSFAVNAGKKELKERTGTEHKWLVDDTKEIDNYNKKLKRKDNISIFCLPCIKNTSIRIKIFCKTASLLKNYRNMLRLLRYEF